MASERLSKACDCNFLIIVDICITFIHKYLLRNKQFGNMALLMRSCAQQIKAKNHFCLFFGGGVMSAFYGWTSHNKNSSLLTSRLTQFVRITVVAEVEGGELFELLNEFGTPWKHCFAFMYGCAGKRQTQQLSHFWKRKFFPSLVFFQMHTITTTMHF
jgi:hypothetical protein